MLIVDERDLGLHNLTVRMEYDMLRGVSVSVLHDGTAVLWTRECGDEGELAVSIYRHPFAHGFKLPEGVRA